jgi:hypothetical protein
MLTRRRLWVFGAALLVAGWGAYAYRVATPGDYDRGDVFKGADYRHFYVLGRLALAQNAAALYDERLQVEVARAEFEPRRSDSFGRPAWGPQMALLFSPLAMLPYYPSWLLFSLFSAIAYLACCWIAARSAIGRRDFALAAMLALAYPAFVTLITFGQISVLAVISLTIAFTGWKRRSPLLVGAGVGLLCYKPTLAVTPVAVLLLTGQWRALTTAAFVASAQMLAGVAWFGFGTLGAYVNNLVTIAADPGPNEPHPELLHSFSGFFNLLLGRGLASTFLTLASSLSALLLLVNAWRRSGATLETRASLSVVLVLVSPHLTTYDLVVLVPGLLPLIGRGAAADRHVTPLIAAVYVAPIIGAALGPGIRIQPSTIALVGLGWKLLKSQKPIACPK